jgi:hypothetical protein
MNDAYCMRQEPKYSVTALFNNDTAAPGQGYYEMTY